MSEAPTAFEDFTVGAVIEHGATEVTREAIIAFAQLYDPQPMHLSDEGARANGLPAIIASGWHTAAMMMKMNCDHLLLNSTSLGAPGVEEVLWKKPVFAGDVLRVRLTIVSARRSSSRPQLGLVGFDSAVLNQKDEVVLETRYTGMFGTREQAA